MVVENGTNPPLNFDTNTISETGIDLNVPNWWSSFGRTTTSQPLPVILATGDRIYEQSKYYFISFISKISTMYKLKSRSNKLLIGAVICRKKLGN